MTNKLPYDEATSDYLSIYEMMDQSGLSKSTLQRKINVLIETLEKEDPEILNDWVLKSPGKPTLYHKLFFERLTQGEADPPADETPPLDPPPQDAPPIESPQKPDPALINYYFLLTFAVLVIILLLYFIR